MKLNRVTVTGADDSVEPEMLGRISKEYPFVEWGILVSQNTLPKGGPRFPSPEWITRLLAVCDPGELNLSVHLCGAWVRRVCEARWDWVPSPSESPMSILLRAAQRVQLNFHGYKHKVEMPDFGIPHLAIRQPHVIS